MNSPLFHRLVMNRAFHPASRRPRARQRLATSLPDTMPAAHTMETVLVIRCLTHAAMSAIRHSLGVQGMDDAGGHAKIVTGQHPGNARRQRRPVLHLTEKAGKLPRIAGRKSPLAVAHREHVLGASAGL